MSRDNVLLVNPNRMRPPIAPLGLEYVAQALKHAGYNPILCDLSFADDWRATLTDAIDDTRPLAVGITLRNIDDAYFASQDFVIEQTTEVVRHAIEASDAPVVLGGVGFSVMPREVLKFTGAPYGIAGDGEEAFPALLACIKAGGDPADVPGAVFRTDDGQYALIAPKPMNLASFQPAPRTWTDAPRYFTEGGQAGIETKRGCDRPCVYCVDPVAKGRALRLRTPDSVAAEFQALLDQGVDVVHLCDSEFNLPAEHAHAVCDAIVQNGVADKVRWYAYLSPAPFDAALADAMARAGCVGVNFGADHADPDMLRRLGRPYRADDIRTTARACQGAGLALMFDMLFGSPGETRDTIARSVDLMRELGPDRVGLSCGVRVYPYTRLAEFVLKQGPVATNPRLYGTTEDNESFLRPIFYVDEALGEEIHGYVWSLVGDDSRFLAANPEEIGRNYNYNDNTGLANAIRNGARGAYWDILRRMDYGEFGEG
ncbi:MAG: radical SAM protein [bacterium]|nr:radical SAM protein [bacterium]